MCQSFYPAAYGQHRLVRPSEGCRVPVPVTATGSIVTVAEAEEILASGEADLVGMGRERAPSTACISRRCSGPVRSGPTVPALRACTDRLAFFNAIRCAVNPLCGRETEFPEITPAKKRKKVMVIGGGPAGKMAAQTCVERGHRVVLYERDSRLAGCSIRLPRCPTNTTCAAIRSG
jgi:NADPH-dependent 2,4-dienoyl-CoA reductase/sulfur reductase-like enzyme